MKIDYRNIDFMVFLPCPMKAAFGKIANQLVQEFERETGEHIRFLPVSAMDEEMARDFLSRRHDGAGLWLPLCAELYEAFSQPRLL